MISFSMNRTAYTLNDLVSNGDSGGKFVATHLCYVAQYGRNPVYAVHDIRSGRVGKFTGPLEALFKLFKNKVAVKVSLQSTVTGYTGELSREDRDKFIDNQVDDVIEVPAVKQKKPPVHKFAQVSPV